VKGKSIKLWALIDAENNLVWFDEAGGMPTPAIYQAKKDVMVGDQSANDKLVEVEIKIPT
jgi:hypothetical protein